MLVMDEWKGSIESSFAYERRAAGGGHPFMERFYGAGERIDRRIKLAHRLQRELHEELKPWISLLVDIENRHFPKLWYVEGESEIHREDNYHPDDADARAKIQQVIREIQHNYEAEFERLK